MRLKSLVATFTIVCAFTCLPSVLFAQFESPLKEEPFEDNPMQHTTVPVPADPNNDHGKGDNGIGNGGWDNGVNRNTEDVPFDGGLSVLVVATVGYGVKRAYDKRKKGSATTV